MTNIMDTYQSWQSVIQGCYGILIHSIILALEFVLIPIDKWVLNYRKYLLIINCLTFYSEVIYLNLFHCLNDRSSECLSSIELIMAL